MNNRFKTVTLFLLGATLALAAIALTISIFWPCYDFGWSAPSPDSKYTVIVLRGDKAAFDDFFYKVYMFPQSDAPQKMKPEERVLMLGRWRSNRYLVYSGYSYPTIRWQTPRKLEITVDDSHPELGIDVDMLYPVKRFAGNNETVVTSLVFGKNAATAK